MTTLGGTKTSVLHTLDGTPVAGDNPLPVKITDGTDTVEVNSDGQMHVVMEGKVDTNNCTDTPLGISEVFTGVATNLLPYSSISILVGADEAGTLTTQYGPDGTDWHAGESYDIVAGANKFFTPPVQSAYYRVVYTNGGSEQTTFYIHTVLKKQPIKWSSHNIDEAISDQDDAELVKAVITGKSPDGVFRNVSVSGDGNLTISDNSSGLAIAEGNVTGKSFVHKFGAAPDFDIADGSVTIWDGAEDDEDYEQMLYNYSTTADIDYIVAEDNSATQDMEIQGLDTNYDLVIQTKSLAGNTPVALDTPLIRVFRMKNVNSSDLTSHVFVYRARLGDGTPTVVTAGVPQTGADVRAVIHGANNQTLMALYTIPNGKTGYVRDWYASTAGARRDSTHTIKLFARPFGQVFQLKHEANISVEGTSYIQHKYTEPERFAAKTDIELRANTDQNIASVAGGFDIVLVDD